MTVNLITVPERGLLPAASRGAMPSGESSAVFGGGAGPTALGRDLTNTFDLSELGKTQQTTMGPQGRKFTQQFELTPDELRELAESSKAAVAVRRSSALCRYPTAAAKSLQSAKQ